MRRWWWCEESSVKMASCGSSVSLPRPLFTPRVRRSHTHTCSLVNLAEQCNAALHRCKSGTIEGEEVAQRTVKRLAPSVLPGLHAFCCNQVADESAIESDYEDDWPQVIIISDSDDDADDVQQEPPPPQPP
eukprot:scpid111462/ scgid30619/ 